MISTAIMVMTGNYPHQPAAASSFLNSAYLSVLMNTKSDIIKDVSSAKMVELFATVAVQINPTFFASIPCMY